MFLTSSGFVRPRFASTKRTHDRDMSWVFAIANIYGLRPGDWGKRMKCICMRLVLIAVLTGLVFVVGGLNAYMSVLIWKELMPMAKMILDFMWAIGTNLIAGIIFLA